MTAVLRGLLICVLCLLALATGAARAGEQPASGELVEVVVGLSQQPLGVTRWKAGRQLQSRTLISAQNRVADTIATQLPEAQVRWRYKLVANGMAVVVPRSQLGPPHRSPGRRQGLSERPLPTAARPQHAADRRSHTLGPRPRERRPGDEDRDHRRGDRPAASVLLAGRVHDACRLPKGPDRVHDGKGDRGTRVSAGQPEMEERVQAVRHGVLVARDPRRGHRRR